MNDCGEIVSYLKRRITRYRRTYLSDTAKAVEFYLNYIFKRKKIIFQFHLKEKKAAKKRCFVDTRHQGLVEAAYYRDLTVYGGKKKLFQKQFYSFRIIFTSFIAISVFCIYIHALLIDTYLKGTDDGGVRIHSAPF